MQSDGTPARVKASAAGYLFYGVLGCVVVAGWHALSWLCDDAFIYFRYASNSLLGYGYVWNAPPFRPVEGYTSLLWIAVIDVVWRVTGSQPPEFVNVLSLLFGCATLVLLARLFREQLLPGRYRRHGAWFEYRVYSSLVLLVPGTLVWMLGRIGLPPRRAMACLAVAVLASYPVSWTSWYQGQKTQTLLVYDGRIVHRPRTRELTDDEVRRCEEDRWR